MSLTRNKVPSKPAKPEDHSFQNAQGCSIADGETENVVGACAHHAWGYPGTSFLF